jgi:hypothetical protein
VKIKSTNTILYCRNWQETVEFYRTGLKLLVLSSNEWFVEFKLNEMSRISVANEARTSIKSSDGKGITISLQVANIEQTRAELPEAGVRRHQSRMYGERRQSISMIPKEIDLSFGQDGQRSSHVQTSYSRKLENKESAILGMLTGHLAQP